MVLLVLASIIALGFGYNFLIAGPENFSPQGIQGQLLIFALAPILVALSYKDCMAYLKPMLKSQLMPSLKAYLTSPKHFIAHFLEKDHQKFTLLALWLVGTMMAISNILVAPLMPDAVSLMDRWIPIWLVSMLLALPLGFVLYVLAGYLFYLAARISKGEKNLPLARRIYVFSLLPLASVILAAQLFYSLAYRGAYFTQPMPAAFSYFWSFLGAAAMVYGGTFAYRAARASLKTGKVGSVIFFLVFPIVMALNMLLSLFQGIGSLSPEGYQVQKAAQLLQQGDAEGAKAAYGEALALMNGSGRTEGIESVYLEAGSYHERDGQAEQALEHYRKGLEAAPKDSAIFYALEGKVKMLEGQAEEAVASFEKSIELEPSYIAHNGAGAYLLQSAQGDQSILNEALLHNAKAVELNPNDATAIENLAFNLFELKRYADAKPVYEAVIQLDPTNAPRLLELAAIELVQGGQIRALELYNRVMEIDPSIVPEDVAAGFAKLSNS